MDHTPSPKTPTPFKVFGLQRTGTNLMTVLISRNFHAKCLEEKETGWKHGPPSRVCYADGGLPTRFVLCVKNPYAWLVSCYRYFRKSYRFDSTMPPDFLADPAMTFEEFVRGRSYEFASPVQRWNFAYRCWISTLPALHTAVVRQEDLLGTGGQLTMLQSLGQKLSLEQAGERLAGTDDQIDVNATVRGKADYDRYLLREYMTEYSSSLLTVVNDAIDWGLMNDFGYVREDWALARRQIGDLRLWVRRETSDGREAWQAAGDPYGLRNIKEKNAELGGFVDVGAHLGQTTLLARQLWPDRPAVCYEPCMENYRMLRLNTRDLQELQAIPVAVTDGTSGRVSFATGEEPEETGAGFVAEHGDRTVPAVGLGEALGRLERCDLLKVGCARAAAAILGRVENHATVSRIGWIVGRLPQKEPDRQDVLGVLNKTHNVSVRRVGTQEFFRAERSAASQ